MATDPRVSEEVHAPKVSGDSVASAGPLRHWPWLVAAAILGFLFWRVSAAETWRSLTSARLVFYLPIMAGATLLWFVLDAGACRYLFSRFNTPLRYREACSLRGLTYLLTPVHWSLGRAGLVARLHQLRGVPLLEGASTVALYQTLDVVLLSSLGLLGVASLPAGAMTRSLAPLLGFTAFAAALYLFLIAKGGGEKAGAWSRFRNLPFHHAHRALRLADVFQVFAWRLAYYCVVIASYWLGVRCFDLELTAPLLTATVPVIQGVGALPISPAGLGTQQAIMVYFLAEPGAEAAIMALGLSMPVLTILFRCAIGLVYLKTTRLSAERPAEEAASGRTH